MKLFNTKTNQLETFQSIHPNKVMMYVCGPTVYNYAHIGNARPIVVFDTLKNVLEANGYEVKYVSNYTDIDDKIIRQAELEHLSEQEIALKYIHAYEKLMHDLHAQPVDERPKVTETIQEIIDFIQQLMDKDMAYQVKDNVYFRVNKVAEYGQLSKQQLDELIAGSRVEENFDKEYPFDFVLWKKTEDTGIKWDSPWGQGRPGWHTECVVMIHTAFQTQTIDIHGGGSDLKFPHHENELAQNCACCQQPLANYWIHNAMLNINDEKMSKSLGNVRLAQDVIDQLGSNVTRWILVANHYRQIINLTDETIQMAQNEVAKLEKVLIQANTLLQVSQFNVETVDEGVWQEFLSKMNDDLNTPNASMVLFDSVKQLNQLMRIKDKNYMQIGLLNNTILKMAALLGLCFDLKQFSDHDRALYQAWEQAKAEKNFDKADQLRQQCLKLGLIG